MAPALTQAGTSRKLGLLREIDLFRGLSEADIEAIGHATTMRSCPRGVLVLSPDDPLERLHIVKDGRVRLYRISADGKQLTVDIYDKGTILGDMAWLGQHRPPDHYAETLGDAVICTITSDELRRLIERHPVIGLNIIGHLSRRLQEAEREIESMAYEPVERRLARKLVDLAGRYGETRAGGATVIRQRFTQQELAEMIGTSRETLAHAMAEMRRRRLVSTGERRLAILDAAGLAKIAAGREA